MIAYNEMTDVQKAGFITGCLQNIFSEREDLEVKRNDLKQANVVEDRHKISDAIFNIEQRLQALEAKVRDFYPGYESIR